ncbi:AAA family ATPase [Pendulispora rubella]|uniref:AAA family ATPase n=1 Tax=Pendulispora rubella TaxID=2741070 RepID=A0ABZ2LFY1_9BACT
MVPIDLPQAPDYRVPWDALQVFPWVRALEACPQDPIHHAEGNVWIHTRMVLETLAGMTSWRELPEEDRRAVYLACLLHDVAKPATTRTEDDGRVTAKGHSRRGELMARKILWELGEPFGLRERVCGLIRYHQIPFYLIEREDARRMAAEISLVARCDLLSLVAEADIRGRVCQDLQRILDNIDLYREYCRDEGCFNGPRTFASPHTRYTFFHSEGRHPDVEAWDDTKVNVVVMSGLPGSGKDTYVKTHFPNWPVVSLDGLREELDIDHSDNQGQVVQTARERAKEHLRRGERFVWNATNISRRFRAPLLSLLADYHARITIVYVEAPREALWSQNRSRDAVVPERVIRAMMDRWEVPDGTEAHEIVYAVPSGHGA